jgi:hypothetical protein
LLSSGETLCGRVLAALKSQALLNESVGAGYLDRNWPPAFKKSGAWPLTSLRQSFLNGSLTRLLDPDSVLRSRIVEFVGRGGFGLASGAEKDGTYRRIWYEQSFLPEEVAFEADVFLLTKQRAKTLKGEAPVEPGPKPASEPVSPELETESGEVSIEIGRKGEFTELNVSGNIPPELWNRLGAKLLPKLRVFDSLEVGVGFTVRLPSGLTDSLKAELRQILRDLGLENNIRIE